MSYLRLAIEDDGVHLIALKIVRALIGVSYLHAAPFLHEGLGEVPYHKKRSDRYDIYYLFNSRAQQMCFNNQALAAHWVAATSGLHQHIGCRPPNQAPTAAQ